jgi:hypothetical protein
VASPRADRAAPLTSALLALDSQSRRRPRYAIMQEVFNHIAIDIRCDMLRRSAWRRG